MKEALRNLLTEVEGLTQDEKVKYFLDRNVYIPKLKFGQKVFGFKLNGKKKEIFKGTICGISYALTKGNDAFPETWYTVSLDEKSNEVEILEESQIYTSKE